MPQRHHQGHKRTPKQLALIIKRCLPMVLTGSGMLCTTANAEEYYFDPIMLETTKSGMQTTDLSRFSKKYAQLPGTYQVDIWLNKKKVSQKKITFTANAEQLLQPQFTVEQLRELGIKVDEIPALAEKDDDSVINSLEQIIPGTAAEFDFNHQQLNLSIPQIALYRDARGYVSPSRWDDGIPTLFTNYSFTGSDNRYRQGNRSQRQYLNMQNGANFGPWRLRNYSTWTRNDQTSSWNTISSYLQRDIKALKSQLLLGESATSGSIFSSYTFTGVQLASDDNMLPNSQRGFAPTVRGIANSSAIVTIRQNGYVIYQSNVSAGAFEINDLYPSSNSGDLEVTIEESDGTQRRFIQPYSSLPMMQRPGHLKYSATAGRYRADANSDSKEPEFAEATAIYGLNNTFTLYGGLLGSEDYYALGIGIGGTLGALGALSMDINRADTQFDNQHSFHGYQWRTQYIKDIPETNTNIAVSYYRYTNDGYFSFNEANTRNWDYNSRQKSEIQFNISQTIFDGVSLYASGSQQDYWGNNDKNRNISVGVSGQQWGVGYSLNYQYSRYTDQNNDRALSLNLSIPLERWLPRSRVSYQMTSQKDRPTQHEMRLDGSLLDDGRLSYSLEQSLDDDNNHNSSLNASYRSPYGTFSAGYSYGNDSSQYNYGVTGGVVNMCAERKLPFVAGHALNCYNAVTLKILLKQGMMRWCMPVELSRDWLVNLLNQCDELGIRNQFEVEVLSYGHLPLAYSARCFTARSEDRPKDECETCCIKYPNGRNVLSQENQQVFVLNGIQTMSGYVYNLGNELASMQGLVDVVRLSPQGTDTFAMLDAFRANENGAAPLPLTANSDCNGYWRRLAGLELQA